MNKILSVTMAGLAFLCTFFTGQTYAGEALNAVNAQVEKKAEEIDQKYGVLLTTQERNDLKIAIVAEKVTAEQGNDETQALDQKAKEAIVTYEITDPTDQRKLLIEMEAQSSAKSGGQSGEEPPL
jgi:hypothetical protein